MSEETMSATPKPLQLFLKSDLKVSSLNPFEFRLAN